MSELPAKRRKLHANYLKSPSFTKSVVYAQAMYQVAPPHSPRVETLKQGTHSPSSFVKRGLSPVKRADRKFSSLDFGSRT
ncbi:hypothetical protein E1B28_006534 [Marasmius oreades]|uniref:Uncharacterized protein n=1 Tax=Marasmius oreades TaxID=181124 RepID=A0A9P7UWE8_9AGAR|nr:uncharacterized protein E1B28_006534 [Marasmius oreades]KAG7095839.1 hypothetical protein E1B28_006534 [Marasmius oreades]